MDLFESEARMGWILLELTVCLAGALLDMWREAGKGLPKPFGCP